MIIFVDFILLSDGHRYKRQTIPNRYLPYMINNNRYTNI